MERRSRSRSVMGLDDDGAGAGHCHLHLPLPLGNEVGRAQHEDAPEARQVRRRSADEGLARAHLPDDGGAPVGFEGEGRAPYGVGLRSQGLSQQAGQLAVLRGPVERRVGLHHPPGDGVFELVDELSEVHVGVSFLARVAGGRRRDPRPTTPPVGTFLSHGFPETSPGGCLDVRGPSVAGPRVCGSV